MKANDSRRAYRMTKNLAAALLLAVSVLALAACADHKMPPNSPSGGIGSPTGPATGPASNAANPGM
jgi:hypothetical protein